MQLREHGKELFAVLVTSKTQLYRCALCHIQGQHATASGYNSGPKEARLKAERAHQSRRPTLKSYSSNSPKGVRSGRGAHLLHAALVDALLADEVHLERPPDGRPRVLHLQQRVVDQVLPAPHLPGMAELVRVRVYALGFVCKHATSYWVWEAL